MTTTLPSTQQPYVNESINRIYEMLFGDNLEVYKATIPTGYPWDDLLTGNPNVKNLTAIAADQQLEARLRLIAYRILQNNNEQPARRELLGVIVEVGMDEGLDVLAAFSDGHARYINHSERMIVWEARTAECDNLINKLFEASINVVGKIGPWTETRRPFPGKGMIRMSFLVSDGLYFGEGPFEVLAADAMGGPVVQAATELMLFLTQSDKN